MYLFKLFDDQVSGCCNKCWRTQDSGGRGQEMRSERDHPQSRAGLTAESTVAFNIGQQQGRFSRQDGA